MIYFLALVPATMLTAAGYGVLFLAHRSEGSFKSFGRYLGFWAFTLAALVIIGGIVGAARGERMHGMMMQGGMDHGPMCACPYMHGWRHPPPGGAPPAMPGTPPMPASPPADAAPSK